MSAIDAVRAACEKFNEAAKQKAETLRSYHKIPVYVTSQVQYDMEVDPIQYGDREDYLDGKYDSVLHHYRRELQRKFEEKAILKGLMPKVSLEEYMGDEFVTEPKPTFEYLKLRVEEVSRFLSNITSMVGNSGWPNWLLEEKIKSHQSHLEGYMSQIKNKQYCVSKEDHEYRENWIKKQDEYYALFK